jgi:hypothetical protein
MCFSAQADVVMGVAVGAVGVDTLRHVTDRRELPLALLPLLFAVHQLVEAFVWWGLDGTVPLGLGRAAAVAYLIIAFVLPVLVPLTVVAIEPDRVRRRVMLGLAGLGAVVSTVLVLAVVTDPVALADRGLHVSYDVGLGGGGVLTELYVVAVCGAFLASSSRRIVVFGALNLVAVAVLGFLTLDGVISLWCAWAAVTSVLIDLHLRTSHRGDLDGHDVVAVSA